MDLNHKYGFSPFLFFSFFGQFFSRRPFCNLIHDKPFPDLDLLAMHFCSYMLKLGSGF